MSVFLIIVFVVSFVLFWFGLGLEFWFFDFVNCFLSFEGVGIFVRYFLEFYRGFWVFLKLVYDK